jgi:YcxB-like protein
MTLEYALTRAEVARGFVVSLRKSPKFRRTILMYAIAVGVFYLLMRGLQLPLSIRDVLGASAWAIGLLLFMPIWLFIRAKTGRRLLVTSTEGIYTEIGKIHGEIPWRKIRTATHAGRFVLITRKGGNSFFIPNRAFSSPAQRDEFLREVHGWTS